MLKLSLEDLKIDFVMNVYESITKQIQQMDLKISILISWNGIIAVMLGREISAIYKGKVFEFYAIGLAIGVLITLVLGSIYCYKVLKPRSGNTEEGFAGLLYSGDIMKLGNTTSERIASYMNHLLEIDDYDKFYKQFTKSIVLISSINQYKNKMFIRGLLVTVISFSLLVGLLAVVGVKLAKI